MLAPRYPTTNAYGVIPGAPAPVIETNNTIRNPTGPEYQFSVGEGTYVLKEDIHLATPPAHPSEPPVTNPNPLSTAPHPVVAGTKLSLVQIKPRTSAAAQAAESLPLPTNLYRHPTVSASSRDTATHDGPESHFSADTTDGNSSLGSKSGGGPGADPAYPHHVPEKFGNGNASLAPAASGKNHHQRKRPKTNIAKSNSSFVSRIVTHESLTRRLAERSPEDLMAFANVNRAFCWLDLDSPIKQEPLSKTLFTKAHPICHDVNMLTRSASQLDVIIGFSTGDIIWFDPISNKYARLNKNGAINPHAVMEIKWLPGSETLFLAAHNDGSLIVYDREKDDAPFFPEDPPPDYASVLLHHPAVTASNGRGHGHAPAPASAHGHGHGSGASLMGFFGVRKSVRSPNQKTNPLSYWSVAKGPIAAYAFSPDCEHLAVVSEDGCLRVLNFVKEKLLDVYLSYYGGQTCVCWSPDGRYIVTGGQDDLVSIWSFSDRRLVARCEGHHSWVSSVAFDPWRCDDRTYRFGSVGYDCRLLLWDFSEGMLHKPKVAAATATAGATAGASPQPHRGSAPRGGESQSLRMRSDSNLTAAAASAVAAAGGTGGAGPEPLVHAVGARAQTAVLPPVMSKVVDPCPLTQLLFRADAVITTCVEGHIKTWNRPQLQQQATTAALASGGGVKGSVGNHGREVTSARGS